MTNKILVNSCLLSLALILFSCDKSVSHPLFIEGDGVIDFEGNEYKTVIIGDQEWMAENLSSWVNCDGDSIPTDFGSEQVKVYDGNTSDINVFGLHYSYLAVEDTSNLCPCGWHVPSELEFSRLIDYLGGFQDAMQKMKSTGTKSEGNGYWVESGESYKTIGYNTSGFNALPAGIIFYDNSMLRDSLTKFWIISSNISEASYFEIGNTAYVGKNSFSTQTAKEVNYHSIRCIKDL